MPHIIYFRLRHLTDWRFLQLCSPALFPTLVSNILASEEVKTDRQAIDTLNVHSRQIGPGEGITISTMVTTTQTITKNTQGKFWQIARAAVPDDA
jgi:hypothetical protein